MHAAAAGVGLHVVRLLGFLVVYLVTLTGCSVTSELVVCNTSPAAAAAPSPPSPSSSLHHRSTTTTTSSTARVGARLSAPASPVFRRQRQSTDDVVTVVIDGATVASVSAATFTYVDDPVISDVVSRASILRSVLSLIHI